MCALFLLRQPILDWLVPTTASAEIEAIGQHSLVDKVKGIIAGGFGKKAAMEWGRWAHQFHAANLAHLLALVAGLTAAAALLRRTEDAAVRVALCLFGGFLTGAVVMFAVDPHHTSGHAMVLAVIGYVAGGIAVARLRELGSEQWRVVAGVLALLSLTAALKVAHTGIIYKRYAMHGISTATITSALENAIGKVKTDTGDPVRVEGATEIWPYLTHRGERIEITDPDRYTFANIADVRPDQNSHLLVVTDDHYKAGWAGTVHRWERTGLVVPMSRLGVCGGTSRCLEIYRIVKAGR